MLQLQPACKPWPLCEAGDGRWQVLIPGPWGCPSPGRAAVVGENSESGSITSPSSLPQQPGHNPLPPPFLQLTGYSLEGLSPGHRVGVCAAAACNGVFKPSSPSHQATGIWLPCSQVQEQSLPVPMPLPHALWGLTPHFPLCDWDLALPPLLLPAWGPRDS